MANLPSIGRSRLLIVLVLLGLAAVGFAVYSQTAGKPDAAGDGVQTSDEVLETAYTDLCETRSLAGADVEEARGQFYGKVHSPLHDIARKAEEADRAVAARMLEAKNDVEQSFNTSAPAEETTAALDLLLTRTAEALNSIEVTTSVCTPS
ncbi:MAG TPA: hypothetical protein VFV09_09895 [Actinomycetota bacterium]|nr:hypothetical protein [Actinomycetota bacterium]